MCLIGLLLGIAGISSSLSRGQVVEQSRSAAPTFDVVSIKPNNSGDRRTGMFPLKGDRFVANNVTVRQLIQFSYKVQDFQIIDGPDWTKLKRYDVEAKVPLNTVGDQVPQMLQSLLTERFYLRSRLDSQQLPVYFLGTAKSGAKLRPAPTCTDPNPASSCPGISMQAGGLMIGHSADMQRLVGNLSFLLSRPVLDDTHLTESYDFELRWRPDGITIAFEPTKDDQAQRDSPDIFTAIEQQLGLKLRAGKAPTRVLRIDGIEEPTGN